MIIDTELVGRRGIDAAEPVGRSANVDGATVPDRRIGGEARGDGKQSQGKDEPTHDRTGQMKITSAHAYHILPANAAVLSSRRGRAVRAIFPRGACFV